MSNLSPTAAAIAATAGLAASSAYGIPLEHQNALLHDQQNARYSAHYNQLAQSSMHSIHTQPASTPPSANTYLQYVSNGGSPNIDGQNSKPFRSTLNPAAATFHMNSNNNAAYASNSPSHYQTSTVSGATTGDFYPNAAAAAAAAAGLNDFQNPANTAAMHHTSFTTNDAFAALQASSASAPANQFHNGFGGAAAAPAAAAHSFGHQQQQPSPPSSTSSFNNNSNVCRLFLQGNCHFGANCRYVHPGTSNSTVNNTFTSAQQSSTSTPAVNGNLSSMNAASAAAVLNNAAALNSGANSSQYNLVLEQLLLAQKQGAMNDQVAGLLQQLISLNLNSNGNSGANAAPNNNASVSMNNSSPLMGNAHLSNQGNAVNQMNNGGHRGSGFGNTARGNGFEFRREFPSGAGSASQGGFAAGGGDFNRGFQNNFSRQDQFGRSFSASSPSAAGGLVNANRGGGAGGSSKWSAYSGFALNNMRDEALEKALFSSQIVTGINFDKYDEIEVSVTGEEIAQPIHSFDDLQLPQTLRDNIQLARYTKPTPIQRHALPNALKLRDVMACAQTGSGKTAAYLFPLITHLLTFIAAGQWPVRSYERRQSCPFGLILAPTRELATQIYDEAVKFTYRTGLHSVVVYGGVDAKIQYRELGSGNCDLLIATPGRLIDFLDRRRISLQNVGYLVFDEADRMLDMGFEPQIRKIITEYDLTTQRQTLMFSATFPREIQKLAADFLDRYIFVTIGRVGSASEMITQKLVYVEDHEKRDVLLKELGGCDELTLIFVSTKKGADILEEYLLEKRVSAASIHGDRSQAEREYALKQFKSREANVLIATDVASRGLDIPHVKYVINFDLPTNIDDYVHRIGRTGRAGNTGTAISFYNETSNSNLAHELYSVLLEAKQLIPDFLEKVVIQARRGGGNRFSGFGGKDYRESHQYGSRGGRGRGGFRGRGRGGNGGGRGGGGSRGGFDRAFSVNAGSVAASSAAAVNALAAAAAASRPQSHGFARQSQFDDRANFASQDTSAASSGGRSSAANIPAMW